MSQSKDALTGQPHQDDGEKPDCRQHPEHYRVGRGEQGVLTIEPYKGELLPHWRFKTPDDARASSQKLLEMFFLFHELLLLLFLNLYQANHL